MTRRTVLVAACALAALATIVGGAAADSAPQALPFQQNWSNTGLITVDDNWAGVPGFVGYRGDGLTTVNDVDPQIVVAEGTAVLDVNANQTNPNTFTTGGVTEFHLTDPTIALTGSGTADAPHVVFNASTVGVASVQVSYNLRDLDGSADNAAQQVALQYRVGTAGAYINVPAGYVADATTGPDLATLVTPVSVTLPAAAGNQPHVQLRVITTNATGNDEWVGIDDILVAATSTPGESAPAVATTSPTNGASGVARNASVTVTFSEAVTPAAGAFALACEGSPRAFTQSGGPTTYTLDPTADFAFSETCTVTVTGAAISDNDAIDPPDTMTADHVFSFTTVAPPPRISQIQGASHVSPFVDMAISGVEGIVTARRGGSGGGLWLQDPTSDGNAATSEGIFVFFGGNPPAQLAVGARLSVSGIVREARGGSDQLAVTRIASPIAQVLSTGNLLPAAVQLGGVGGLTPPTETIDDDTTGNVETGPTTFDPADDAIDFYEALEGMLTRIDGGTVVGPWKSFGEMVLIPNGVAATGLRTPRGGILYAYADPQPERMTIDDEVIFGRMPQADVGDAVTSAVVGPMDYSFDNFKIQATSMPTVVRMGLEREVANMTLDQELAVATFNVENLTVGNPQAKFDELASMIVDNLRSPDLIAIEEIQDDSGATDNGTVDATQTWEKLVAAIAAAGGPTYQWRSIDPVNNEDGGAPGANIRVGFLFHTDRDLKFIDRPGGGSTTETTVVDTPTGPQLSASPGRIGTQSAAFEATRKSLVGEFKFRGKTLFFVANHFSSKGDDEPLFSRFQPPTRFSEVARHGQAAVVNAFVDSLLVAGADAHVVLAGDINDFEFSETVDILEGGVMTSFVKTLPANERYSYVFEGNSQTLDQILGTNNVVARLVEYDVVHVNAEFAVQASDHEPSVARINMIGRP